MSVGIQKTYRELVSMIKDVEHIDSLEKVLEVGIQLVRHLPEPFDEQTSEKLNEIADCLNLLTEFVINEARYARMLYEMKSDVYQRSDTPF